MNIMQKIVVASGNQGKIKEFRQIFAKYNIEIIPQDELNVPEIDEPFFTFVENSLHKARHCAKVTGLPALADDSGLCVEVLGGAPGIFSARYAGTPKSDQANLEKLLQVLSNEIERQAYFYTSLVFVRSHDDPQPIIAEGIFKGVIDHRAKGTNGHGYDPIFYVPEHQATVAELDSETKNKISHRGKALLQMLDKLADAGLLTNQEKPDSDPIKALKKNAKIAISWSGGKDCCLALHYAKEQGLEPTVLISAVDEQGYSRSNGASAEVLKLQARMLNLPIVLIETSWQAYENKLVKALKQAKEKYQIEYCVFGDIDIKEHRHFEENICHQAKILAHLPLWNKSRSSICDELIQRNILSRLSVVRKNLKIDDLLAAKYHALKFELLKALNVDICGENGEFHTVVYDAPLFSQAIELTAHQIHELDQVMFCEFTATIKK